MAITASVGAHLHFGQAIWRWCALPNVGFSPSLVAGAGERSGRQTQAGLYPHARE
jgi:hypothetical protein